jgi:hypothetical protein
LGVRRRGLLMNASPQPSGTQERTRRFFLRERPVLGGVLLYSLIFLLNSATYDLVRLVRPVNYLREIERYTLPLAIVAPLYAAQYRAEKRRVAREADIDAS